MGLGSADVTTLAEARAKVHDLRRTVAKGEDPIDQKREQRAVTVTFASVVTAYMAVQERRYRNPGSARNEHRLLLTHAGTLGALPVASIGTSTNHCGRQRLALDLMRPQLAHKRRECHHNSAPRHSRQ
jgi:hypothetical protein